MAEQLVTHAGHPCDADRWCVNDLCNALAEDWVTWSWLLDGKDPS